MSKTLAVPRFLGNQENNIYHFPYHWQYFLHAINLKLYFTLFCWQEEAIVYAVNIKIIRKF